MLEQESSNTGYSSDQHILVCKHFVKRKKRFCKMTVRKGFEYCGEHLPVVKSDNNENKSLRVVCPLDSKHTCFLHKLNKHLKICNARPNTSVPYIQKNINLQEGTCEDDLSNTRQLSLVSPSVISKLVARIETVYKDHIEGKITENIKNHSVVESEILRPDYGERTKKHLYQASSLLGILVENNLIQNDTCYIEFGAGKGQLSFWISEAIQSKDKSSVLLVERASHRHKYDNKLDHSEREVHRIKVDIADLVLSNVDIVSKSKYIVGLTKHLCGDATDLALTCMKNFETSAQKVIGVVMAFCCHHRCKWETFTGQDIFKVFRFSKEDFDIMCGMVSWAICGTGQSRNTNKVENEPDINERDKEIGLSREQKKEIGIKCKHILDFGRMHYLEQQGFTCKLHYYVSPTVSPENMCVVGTRNII